MSFTSPIHRLCPVNPLTALVLMQRDGAVCLRGVFDGHWVDEVRNGVERNLRDPGPNMEVRTPL